MKIHMQIIRAGTWSTQEGKMSYPSQFLRRKRHVERAVPLHTLPLNTPTYCKLARPEKQKPFTHGSPGCSHILQNKVSLKNFNTEIQFRVILSAMPFPLATAAVIDSEQF